MLMVTDGRRRRGAARKGGNAVHDRLAASAPLGSVVGIRTVDDPYEVGAKIKVAAQLRDDPLGRLYARDQIDHAQYNAGRHYQGLLEHAEVGGLKAMDTTKEPVDGSGQFIEPITDRQIKAAKELNRLSRVLGQEGEALVRATLGLRCFVTGGAPSRQEREYLGRRFRECLDTLAGALGYA